MIERLARALGRVATIKRNRPDIIHQSDKQRLAETLARREPNEADIFAAYLRGQGYHVTYGWDADIGVYAEVSKDNRTTIRSRCRSILECLKMAVRAFERSGYDA